MNLLDVASMPSTMKKVEELLQLARGNPTLTKLTKKLDGANLQQAYDVVSNLSDEELRVLAALIAAGNEKFGRTGGSNA